MISIVILFCDKDFKYIPDLIKNIQEKVNVPYELVFVDNREENQEDFNVETNWKYFSFGYNAKQVQGRKKGIEIASGDYIWFVDADDKVLEVSADMGSLCNRDYDFIVFKKSIEKLFSNQPLLYRDILYKTGVQLWDKWVKTSVLRKVEEHIPTTLSGTASEDFMLVIGGLKYSKSVYFYPQEIYEYQRQRSTWGAWRFNSVEHFKAIIHGYAEVTKCASDMLTDEEKQISEWELQRHSDVRCFIEKLMYCDPKIIPDCVKIITETFEYNDIILYWRAFYEYEKWSKQTFHAAMNAFKKEFPDHATEFEARNVFKYYKLNEEGEEYCYDTKVTYIEQECEKNWNHKLSVICLVYEGNVKYLSKFLKMTKGIEIEHEVVVVDNRDDKTKPLKCNLKEAVVVKTEKNLGILDGRRFGFEHSTGDYIWFVDIDDEIMDVHDRDYGNCDIIKFPFFNDDKYLNEVKPRIITGNAIATGNTVGIIDLMLWDKWFKREALEKAYKKIPSFFCIFGEDNLLSLNVLDCVESVRCIDCMPMYRYCTNQDSITLRDIKTKEEIDRLFLGFEQVKELYSKCSIWVSVYEEPTLVYYLGIASHADPKIQPYFIDVLKEKLGKQEVTKNILKHYPKLRQYIDS
jgi:glycosyltransferase involved in cell wall biosynthesis